MIKRITNRGTATVGELIKALQEFSLEDEAYIAMSGGSHGAGESIIDTIESERNWVFIGNADAFGEVQP